MPGKDSSYSRTLVATKDHSVGPLPTHGKTMISAEEGGSESPIGGSELSSSFPLPSTLFLSTLLRGEGSPTIRLPFVEWSSNDGRGYFTLGFSIFW